jgi:hypothetical protein
MASPSGFLLGAIFVYRATLLGKSRKGTAAAALPVVNDACPNLTGPTYPFTGKLHWALLLSYSKNPFRSRKVIMGSAHFKVPPSIGIEQNREIEKNRLQLDREIGYTSLLVQI